MEDEIALGFAVGWKLPLNLVRRSMGLKDLKEKKPRIIYKRRKK